MEEIKMDLIKEDLFDELPKSIREGPDPTIWGTCWYRANCDNKMATAVFCGERGGGKTYNLLKKSDDLHRTTKDKPLFRLKNLCFTATQFKRRLTEDFDEGTVICLDDAGLALYNKEALTRIVREIGKSLQTIRRKNPIILMSLPYFKLLEGHARLFADMYVEVVGRNKATNQNLVKIQLLKKDYYAGEIYRYTMLKHKTVKHYKFGITYEEPIPEFFKISKPRRSLWEPYEKYKETELDKWDAQSLARIEHYEKSQITSSKPTITFSEVLTYVRENIERFKHARTGKVEQSKILEVFNGEEKPTIGINAAQLVARNLNAQK